MTLLGFSIPSADNLEFAKSITSSHCDNAETSLTSVSRVQHLVCDARGTVSSVSQVLGPPSPYAPQKGGYRNFGKSYPKPSAKDRLHVVEVGHLELERLGSPVQGVQSHLRVLKNLGSDHVLPPIEHVSRAPIATLEGSIIAGLSMACISISTQAASRVFRLCIISIRTSPSMTRAVGTSEAV